MTTHDMALMQVNTLKTQLTQMVRQVVIALEDGKIKDMERMTLGIAGLSLGTTIIAMLQGSDTETRKDMLYVLEHATFTLPDEG